MRKLTFLFSALVLTACGQGVPLKAVVVAKGPVEATVSTVNSGTVEADQEAILNFGIIGRVAEISVKLGDQVKKNQKIARLDNTDLETILSQAKKDLGTAEKLYKEGLISSSALSDARKVYEIAKSNYDKSTLIAPFDGLVSELNLQIGEMSNSSTSSSTSLTSGTVKPPIRIVDLKPRIIRGQIDELDLSKVKVGAPARVRIQSVRPEPFEALVTKVIPYISTSKEQERTAQVELHLKDQALLVPAGASADIEIVVDKKESALAVPARTVLGTQGRRYVYRLDGSKLEKVNIKAGIGNYDSMEILEGLQAGDTIVYPSETIEMKEGLKVKPEIQPWPSSK